jgi:hypothetical protein
MWHIAKRLLGEEPESKKVAEAIDAEYERDGERADVQLNCNLRNSDEFWDGERDTCEEWFHQE